MQYEDEKREKLDNLQKRLYSRETPEIIDESVSKFTRSYGKGVKAEKVKEQWENIKNNNFDELASKFSNMAKTKHKFIKRIFIFSVLFFVLAAGVATFVFWIGINTISSKNVDIKIAGPLSVGAGQEVSFDINVINNNNVDLEFASMLLEYPEGTRSLNDLTKELTQERFELETVQSGKSYSQNVKLVFFGEKESIKEIKIVLEYRVENSSALFYKEKKYEITISSAPVIITPTYPKEVNSNQEITFSIEVVSNSKDEIKDLLVNIEYPFGFNFRGASPGASYGENVWHFSSLKPGEKKKILITGNIIGQDNEERVFRISTGSASEKDERVIGVPFMELTESVLIKKAFIGLQVLVGGKDGDFVARGGVPVSTSILVRNNLPSKLYNTTVEVFFGGAAFNEGSVVPGNNGFFQSSNDSILWDKRSSPDLAEMDTGALEEFSFQLITLPYEDIAQGKRPEVEITVKVRGERVLDSGSTEEVIITETRKITLSTDLILTSKIVRSSGNLENSGPIPPQVDVPTTYTAVWSLSNSFNQVSNVEVRATLPSYVKWTGLKNPSNENLRFDEVSKEMIWTVGNILPNTSSSEKQVYFQLEFLPSISQVGKSPELLGTASLTGLDKITGQQINQLVSAVTTNFFGDLDFNIGDDKVVQ
ncbi:MAG: hypothetical protein JW740_01100 [Candidatus Zambryskibacteria bacterium]|nr:hypothetical protein [Candidatus Zambryskibacteria bacterium]